MYRCIACDHPAQYGHSRDCPLGPDIPEKIQEPRINIASGEDAMIAEQEEEVAFN